MSELRGGNTNNRYMYECIDKNVEVVHKPHNNRYGMGIFHAEVSVVMVFLVAITSTTTTKRSTEFYAPNNGQINKLNFLISRTHYISMYQWCYSSNY